jgi:hypothetical protein
MYVVFLSAPVDRRDVRLLGLQTYRSRDQVRRVSWIVWESRRELGFVLEGCSLTSGSQ